MAIALGEVAEDTLAVQAAALAVVAVAITFGVYGVVGLIVKMDDVGLHLARRRAAGVRAIGRGLVAAMPVVLSTLGTVGIAAMIWVGGGIIVHGLAKFGVAGPEHVIEGVAVGAAAAMPAAAGVVHWLATAAGSGIVGMAVGGIAVATVLAVHRLRR